MTVLLIITTIWRLQRQPNRQITFSGLFLAKYKLSLRYPLDHVEWRSNSNQRVSYWDVRCSNCPTSVCCHSQLYPHFLVEPYKISNDYSCSYIYHVNIVIPQEMGQLVLILFVRVFLLLLLLHWEHSDICIILQPRSRKHK